MRPWMACLPCTCNATDLNASSSHAAPSLVPGCEGSPQQFTERFLDACRMDDCAAARAALAEGANANAKHAHGRTLLHVATRYGAASVAALLLAAGADKDAADADGLTPLMLAAGMDHRAVVQLLLDRGASSTKADTGWTALHIACAHGHAAVVQLLLQAGFDKEQPTSSSGSRPLHKACSRGHVSVVQQLLEADVQLDAYDNRGQQALHVAACKGHADIITILVQAGAVVNAPCRTVPTTALHFACYKGHAQAAEALLNAGADPQTLDMHGMAPMEYACANKSAEVVMLLVEAGVSAQNGLWPPELKQAFIDMVLAKNARLAAQLAELEQLRSIQPGVQQLIMGAAGMMKRLDAERMPRHE